MFDEGCGHCGYNGPLIAVGDVTARQDEIDTGPMYGEVTASTMWALARCPNCDQPTLETYQWLDLYDSAEDIRAERIFPTPLKKSALPVRVQKQLDAAHRVKHIDPSFYAVGIRRTLEAVCADQGVAPDKLERQIAALVKANKLPGVFARMATQLRRLGNWGAHDAQIEVLPDDVPLIEEFAEAILDFLYWAPTRLDSVEQALKARVDGGL